MPGGIDKEVVVNQARSLLDELAAGQRGGRSSGTVRPSSSSTDIEHLDAVLKDSRIRISAAVAASQTTLTDIFGVGQVITAMLIGNSGP